MIIRITTPNLWYSTGQTFEVYPFTNHAGRQIYLLEDQRGNARKDFVYVEDAEVV